MPETRILREKVRTAAVKSHKLNGQWETCFKLETEPDFGGTKGYEYFFRVLQPEIFSMLVMLNLLPGEQINVTIQLGNREEGIPLQVLKIERA